MSKELKLTAKELRLIKYEENTEYDSKKFEDVEEKSNSVQVGISIKIDSDTKLIQVGITTEVTTKAKVKQEEISQKAFEVIVLQEFYLENLDSAFPPNDKGEVIFDEESCNYFGAITIAEARGIISAIPKREEFQKMNIPIFKWKNVFQQDIVVNKPIKK